MNVFQENLGKFKQFISEAIFTDHNIYFQPQTDSYLQIYLQRKHF